MVMIYYEDHSFSSSQADDMDERRSTISVSPEVSADEKPFSFFDLLCYADKIDWFLMNLGTIGSIILLGRALDAFGANINEQEGMFRTLSKVSLYAYHYYLPMSIF
jgi:ATP-binding cassette, subfamily B (MDR/TAP), member 1